MHFDKSICRVTKLRDILWVSRRQIMKLLLIALGLLATTGVVYAACVFC
jgi:preprotein translocase subunit SecE